MGVRSCGGVARYGLLVLVVVVGWARPAVAQLDPLLFLRSEKPNVLLLVDTAPRMLFGAGDDYFDPHEYDAHDEPGLLLAQAPGPYRRLYASLRPGGGSGDGLTARTIQGVSASSPEYAGFDHRSRIGIAKRAIAHALRDSFTSVRFGLVAMRQSNPALPDAPNAGPVSSEDPGQRFAGDFPGGGWIITVPTVAGPNRDTGPVPPLVLADAPTANAELLAIAERPWRALGSGPALVPAGREGPGSPDAPLAGLLEDARAEAARLIAADDGCRNTVAVLLAGGGESNAGASPDAAAVAATYRSIRGRRVPVYVLAILPAADDRAGLRAIAAESGGQYFEVGADDLAHLSETGYLAAVPVAVRAIAAAVQHAFAAPADVNVPPTAALPLGPLTEYQTTGPVVGTVNLEGARYADGTLISDHELQSAGGAALPQRGNVMLTAGFALPGFEGRLRAYRLYRPRADAGSRSGFTFVADGGALWAAHLPEASARNIYTVMPGGEVVAFAAGNVARLTPYLSTFDPAGLIAFVREQPLGAVVGSVPAVLDAPSATVPPDPEFPAFAARHRHRRALVFVGASDGMLHAFDARSGLEVWAMIPFNLLPKLQALRDGQGMDRFAYFVEGSPRLADVRADRQGSGASEWRTHLYVGEGAGGTFYQAFDVTLDGLAAAGITDSSSEAAVLSYFRDPATIPFVWAFPRYGSFDYTLQDHEAGLFGDVSALGPHVATAIELSAGQSWSSPAVGTVGGRHVLVMGSGFFPFTREGKPWRQAGTVRAGTTLYLLDAATGQPLDSRTVPSDALAETTDDCGRVGDCRHLRNALQADPALVGPAGSPSVARAYAGDLDGNLWSFDLGVDASGRPAFQGTRRLVYSAGASHPLFGSVATVTLAGHQYLFFGSGSDLLPSSGVSHAYRLFGIVDGIASPRFTIDLEPIDAVGNGEKVSLSPAVAGDTVFFTTSAASRGSCAAGDAHLYALTFTGGAAFDANGDGAVTPGEPVRAVTLAAGGRATAPFVSDRHILLGAGGGVSVIGDPEGFNSNFEEAVLRVLSWRHVR